MINWTGRNLSLQLSGSSHGAYVAGTLHGLQQFEIDEFKVAAAMARRRPGGKLASQRREPDVPEFSWHSDCLEVKIYNQDVRPQDYANHRDVPRPGHADLTHYLAHGLPLPTGGGTNSGRMTAPLVALGAALEAPLSVHKIATAACLLGVHGTEKPRFDHLGTAEIQQCTSTSSINAIGDETPMISAIQAARQAKDSIGGTIGFMIEGAPGGRGGDWFAGIESQLSQLMFAIPGVRGISFGHAEISTLTGSQANDAILPGTPIRTRTNNCGGILGGRATGDKIWGEISCKPTPSIAAPQESVNLATGEPTITTVTGRHDPCFAIRATPVVNAMCQIFAYDQLVS